MCRCLSKLLFSGQRTIATSWPFVTIYTPQTRSLYDITATFLTVLWARNRTVLTITSWCVTTLHLKKWILREIFFCILYWSKACKSVFKIVFIVYSPYISTSHKSLESTVNPLRLTYLASTLQGVYNSERAERNPLEPRHS